jgi:eukaryotic-like serine/threonine-protein kinase
MAEPSESYEQSVTIGNFQLIAVMGKGGMSTVFLAKVDGPAGFNKLAVLKILRADLADSDGFAEMFLNEARLAARLTHPNIVHTYGAGEEQDRLYIAMEYLDGFPWSRVRRRLMSRKSLPLGVHLKVLADTLAGLHYAHELRDYDGTPLRVVHCDVSPQNVFVTHDGQVKVVDFGVARAVNYSRNQNGSLFLGRPAYCSPEQARGEELDRRADVFSVGVMLWEAIANKRFVTSKDIVETLRRRSIGEEPRIREVVPQVSKRLAQICDCALALDPRNRFATAADFRKQLQNYIISNYAEVDETLIAELIDEPFHDERQRLNNLIEQRFTRPSLDSKPVDKLFEAEPQDSSENTLRADPSPSASVSRLKEEKAVLEPSISATSVPEKKRPPWWVFASGIAACIGVTAALLFWRSSTASTISVSPVLKSRGITISEPLATGAGTARSIAQTVQLAISATPSSAILYLDGIRLPANPYRQVWMKDAKARTVLAVADGYYSQQRVITLDRDQVLDVTLTATDDPAFRLRTRIPVYARNRVEPGAPAQAPAALSGHAPVATEPRMESPLTEPPPAAPSAQESAEKNTQGRATPSNREMDFDDRIVPKAAPARQIYEEDPY